MIVNLAPSLVTKESSIATGGLFSGGGSGGGPGPLVGGEVLSTVGSLGSSLPFTTPPIGKGVFVNSKGTNPGISKGNSNSTELR